jgi:DNA modification methylase
VDTVSLYYETSQGQAYLGKSEEFLKSEEAKALRGKVELILTSPPYPLLAAKAYGNEVGQKYKSQLMELFSSALDLLSPTGSLVVEIGNAWEKGKPEMQTLPVETLLSLKTELGLKVCQMFVWDNPNKIPGPASWVNIKRIRIKDSFTHIWWFSKGELTKADNRRVLTPYTSGMESLLRTQKYNRGLRPSGHTVGEGFLSRNSGAIPSSVLRFSNSKETKQYKDWCQERGLVRHPARMPMDLASFFIKFLSEPGDIVYDPFGGSNTTGKAAEQNGRRWVISELSEEYLHGSKGRFTEEIT